jgi:hypothetical protein
MEDFLSYHKKMLRISIAVCVIAAVAIVIALPGDFPRLFGFIAGAAAQLAKFGLLDAGTVQRISADPEHAAKIQLRATLSSLLLFGLAIAVVFVCKLDVWALALGIFLPRLLLIADTFFRPDPFKNGGQK